MKVLQELLHNDILLAGILSWFVAQVIKTILYAVINKELEMTRLMGDGGMPSAHSATVTAVAAMTGLLCGFGSPLFALACILADRGIPFEVHTFHGGRHGQGLYDGSYGMENVPHTAHWAELAVEWLEDQGF